MKVNILNQSFKYKLCNFWCNYIEENLKISTIAILMLYWEDIHFGHVYG